MGVIETKKSTGWPDATRPNIGGSNLLSKMPKEISPACEGASQCRAKVNETAHREESSESPISWAEEAFDHGTLRAASKCAIQGHSEAAAEKRADEATNQVGTEIERSRKKKPDASRKFFIKLEAEHEKISAEYPTR